jgi:hypothetical protein
MSILYLMTLMLLIHICSLTLLLLYLNRHEYSKVCVSWGVETWDSQQHLTFSPVNLLERGEKHSMCGVRECLGKLMILYARSWCKTTLHPFVCGYHLQCLDLANACSVYSRNFIFHSWSTINSWCWPGMVEQGQLHGFRTPCVLSERGCFHPR